MNSVDKIEKKEVRGWTVNQLIQCDHLKVDALENSSTTLAAIVGGAFSLALVVEDSKVKLLCLRCFKIGLRHRLDMNQAH